MLVPNSRDARTENALRGHCTRDDDDDGVGCGGGGDDDEDNDDDDDYGDDDDVDKGNSLVGRLYVCNKKE
jgi:hypothetical protein